MALPVQYAAQPIRLHGRGFEPAPWQERSSRDPSDRPGLDSAALGQPVHVRGLPASLFPAISPLWIPDNGIIVPSTQLNERAEF